MSLIDNMKIIVTSIEFINLHVVPHGLTNFEHMIRSTLNICLFNIYY